jgi:prophage maintenance system killer protein
MPCNLIKILHPLFNLFNLCYLRKCIENVKRRKGNICDKATELMISIIQNHPFESANRRTAYFCAAGLLHSKNLEFKFDFFTNESAKIFIGIRENYYNFKEIKSWIKNGKIREFKRNL